MYSGTLTAFLAIPAYEKPINSLSDLLHATRHNNYKLILGLQTSNEYIFKVIREKKKWMEGVSVGIKSQGHVEQANAAKHG